MRAFEYGEYRISKEIAVEFQGFQIKIYKFTVRLSISGFADPLQALAVAGCVLVKANSTSCGRLCTVLWTDSTSCGRLCTISMKMLWTKKVTSKLNEKLLNASKQVPCTLKKYLLHKLWQAVSIGSINAKL